MQNDASTYRDMYEGPVVFGDGSADSDNVYWYGGVAYEITMTHKQALDKPTVTCRIPAALLSVETPSAAAADFLLRAFLPYADELNAELYNRSRTERENGAYLLPRPGSEVLVRNAAFFAVCPQKYYENGSANMIYPLPADGRRQLSPQLCFCLRMQVQLPLRRLRKSIQMLCRDLPQAVQRFVDSLDTGALQNALALAERQRRIRAWLKTSDCCAFIANGSILPRAKGTDAPLPDAVPFRSTPEDEREVCGVRGMAVRRGITVIVGGGYSGKSTLLDAIAAGIYDHIAGDGRELVLTDESAVTIAAEDGRSIRNLDISPFVRWLPGDGDVRDFSTDHASGSTSQAANVVEAVGHGASLLLIDEDRSATNFMIRDPLMKALVEREPLTPFTDRVRELYERLGVSTILVVGGSGEYLTPAERVYRMEDYRISDATDAAKALARPADPLPPPALRRIRGAGLPLHRRRARRRPRPARYRQRTPTHGARLSAAAFGGAQHRLSARHCAEDRRAVLRNRRKRAGYRLFKLFHNLRTLPRPAPQGRAARASGAHAADSVCRKALKPPSPPHAAAPKSKAALLQKGGFRSIFLCKR